MDARLVLAPTRWTLRTAVKVMHQVLASLRLEKHPDKTCIGRRERGFEWRGYHRRPGALTRAAKTLKHGVARVRQLYEQEPREGVSARLGAYVRRWWQWVRTGVRVSAVISYPRAWLFDRRAALLCPARTHALARLATTVDGGVGRTTHAPR